MSNPDQHAAETGNRLSGEDAPTWLTWAFAVLGVVVAGVAAWLALTAQPTSTRQVRGDAPTEQAAMSASVPTAGAGATSLPGGGSPSDGAIQIPKESKALSTETPNSKPVDERPAASIDDTGQATVSAAQRTTEEDCPPPVYVPFKLGSATPITKDVQTAIEEVRAFLRQHTEASLSVEGHADSMGAENYNLLLSYWRAKAVVSVLARGGLAEKRMVVRAAGNGAPIEGLPGESEKNRRVVVRVVGIAACLGKMNGRPE